METFENIYRGEMIDPNTERMKREFIARAEAGLDKEPYPNYPTERYIGDEVTVPDGPWSTGEFELPTADEQAEFIANGYQLDDKGRPLHPWFHDMATNPAIGVVNGRGYYWNWGPNYTADPVIITEEERPRLLLILRGDTGVWAFPGGFVDEKDESAVAAALREAREETGIDTSDLSTEVLYAGAVADKRTTAQAWGETTAVIVRIPEAVSVIGQDDAKDAKWFYLDELPENLFGSHNSLISMACEKLGLTYGTEH